MKIHGMSKTKIYKTWKDIIRRCKYHKRYKGRGIFVCKRWYKFENFYKDMGDKPNSLSIDRINNSGNYSPSNCRWANPKTQNNNTGRNIFIRYKKQKRTLAEWTTIFGLNYKTTFARIKYYGFSLKEAFNKKRRKYHVPTRKKKDGPKRLRASQSK